MRTLPSLAVLCAAVATAAAALGACSIDAVTFTQGPAEDCEAAGDEDGNGQADCGDPACAGATSCQLACGNGRSELGEVCDDGNAIDGDGCDNNCTVTGCGNGIKTAGEVCDDGNLINGDGCEDTCKGTGSGSYEAVADATVRTSSGTPDASTNFGTQRGLVTYGSSFGTTARSLIAFDLATVPIGPPIESAHLYVFMLDQAGIDYSVEVREVEAPWSETSVTWNTQPAFGPVIEASLPFQGTNKWWRFDVTALVRRWVAAPASSRGLMLRQDPESFPTGGQFGRFDSREGVDRPYLDIVVGI